MHHAFQANLQSLTRLEQRDEAEQTRADDQVHTLEVLLSDRLGERNEARLERDAAIQEASALRGSWLALRAWVEKETRREKSAMQQGRNLQESDRISEASETR